MAEPHGYLCNLLSKRGRSDLTGVHMTGVSVNVDPNEDYRYELDKESTLRQVRALFEKEEWKDLLVSLRLKGDETAYAQIRNWDYEGYFQVFNECDELYAFVYLTKAEISTFDDDILWFQTLLREVARFVGKVPTSLRITIGLAHLHWREVVEQGDAQEITVGF